MIWSFCTSAIPPWDIRSHESEMKGNEISFLYWDLIFVLINCYTHVFRHKWSRWKNIAMRVQYFSVSNVRTLIMCQWISEVCQSFTLSKYQIMISIYYVIVSIPLLWIRRNFEALYCFYEMLSVLNWFLIFSTSVLIFSTSEISFDMCYSYQKCQIQSVHCSMTPSVHTSFGGGTLIMWPFLAAFQQEVP